MVKKSQKIMMKVSFFIFVLQKLFYDRQCSVLITTSLIISVTLFSIYSMALLGPRKVHFTEISRPYPPPLFTLLPVTSQLMVQFGNDKN